MRTYVSVTVTIDTKWREALLSMLLHMVVLRAGWHSHTNSLHYKYWLFVRDRTNSILINCMNSILILAYMTVRIATA